MATQVTEHKSHWMVWTVDGPGRRRRIARLPVAVPRGDLAALRAEVEKQVTAARATYPSIPTPQEPVV